MAFRRAWLAVVTALCAVAPATARADAPAGPPQRLCCVPSGTVWAVAVQGTTAYIGGSFRHVGPYTGAFAALDPVTGRADEGRAVVEPVGSGSVSGVVYAATPDGAGGWFVGGDFERVDGVSRGNLAHIKADGTLAPDWAPTVDGPVRALARSGGVLYVGGDFTMANGSTPRADLAAFSTSTGVVTSFDGGIGGSGSPKVEALAVGGGVLYVGGSFSVAQTEAGYTHLAAFSTDTGKRAAFKPALDGPVRTLAAVTDGAGVTIYVGGTFQHVGGEAHSRLAALTAGGAPVSTFKAAAGGPVEAMAVTDDRVYAAWNIGGVGETSGLLRAFNRADGKEDEAFAPTFSGFTRWAHALVVVGSTVYLGGRFERVNGTVKRDNLAAFDATTGAARAWDPEAAAGVEVLASDGRRIFAGGGFATVGGVQRKGLAAIDLAAGRLTGFDPDVDGGVAALIADGPIVYAGGDFHTVNGSVPRNLLAAFDASTGRATAFDPNLTGTSVVALARGSTGVYAAGNFTAVNGGLLRSGIAGFDPVTGAARSFAPGVNGAVWHLAARGMTVYLGGMFTQINGTARRYLGAVLDQPGLVGSVTGFEPALPTLPDGLALSADTLYAVGQYQGTRAPLAGFDLGSGVTTAFTADLPSNIKALSPAGGQVFAGGLYFLEALDARTGASAPWSPVPIGVVHGIDSSPEGGLVAVGDFIAMDSPRIGTGPIAHFALAPSAPPAPRAVAGDGRATVNVAAAPSGGAKIGTYTITASPGGRTVTATGPGPAVVDGLANGTAYTFTVRATNTVGTGPPSAPSAPVTPTAEPKGVPPRTEDTVAPRITKLRMSRRRFAVHKRRTPVIAKVRRGSQFRFRLSEKARTTITIARKRAGKRSGWRKAGKLTRKNTRRGANRVNFSGRVGKRRLKPGRYRATLVARDPAGNRSKAVSIRFRIIRGGHR